MRQGLLTAVICCALLGFGAVAVPALEIVYPSHGVFVARSDFLIIRGGKAPVLEAMTVTINGAKSELLDLSSPEYRAAFADFLILQPEWDKGKNAISVDAYIGGKVVANAVADIYFLGNDPTATTPKGYKPFVMHTPEKEGLCQPCHNMKPDKVQLSAESADKNPCASCHKRWIDAPYAHGPAGVFQCVACHDPASKPARYQISKSPAELCAECHFDKVEAYKKNKFVHGPVGVGLCLLCHDPHASSQPAQLLAPTNTLCAGCHDTVVKKGDHVVRGIFGQGHPLAAAVDPSDPGKSLTCGSCHDPHGGQGQALFRRGLTSRMQLCSICHKK